MDDLIALFSEYVNLSKEVILAYKQKLADALANDASDLATITGAQLSADMAKVELQEFKATVEQKNVDFANAIAQAKQDLSNIG